METFIFIQLEKQNFNYLPCITQEIFSAILRNDYTNRINLLFF